MNIGIVTTWFERGAAYVSRQYKDVLEKEHSVFIFARAGEEDARGNPEWDAKNVYWAKKSPIPVSGSIVKNDFIKWIKSNNIDAILFNEQQWWPPILWANELGVITGAYIDYYTEETIPLFKSYDFLLCNTQRHYSAFKWHSNCLYIPWGTDVTIFNVQPQIKEKLTFFHSAGMSPDRKGTETLINAFSYVSKNAKLIIHTQVNLMEYYPHLKELLAKLLEKNQLKIITKTVKAPGLYHLGDVYVYPSKLDGIGLTIAEALSCGLPVITVDNGPMNEFIDKNVGKLADVESFYSRADGYYWPLCTTNQKSLINCLEYYINHSGNIQSLSILARSYAEKNLDWSKNSRDLINIFNSLAKQLDSNADTIIKQFESKKRNIVVKMVVKFEYLFRFSFFMGKLFGIDLKQKFSK